MIIIVFDKKKFTRFLSKYVFGRVCFLHILIRRRLKNMLEVPPSPHQISSSKKIRLGEGGFVLKVGEGDMEIVMCDVIRIRLIRKDERRSGKGNP